MTNVHQHTLAVLLALVCVSAIMLNFHDQFWYAPDEGVYAYVAQRANAGDIIHRDVIDLHSGYGNALNALAFRVFGEDLLSLRHPLIAITFVQCIIAYVLLMHRGALVAFVGAITVAAFSFVQFPNPSANWHALAMFFGMCLLLDKSASGSDRRLLIAGAILGLCFFTRQLNGVLLTLGLICVLLAEARTDKKLPRSPALIVGGISFAGLLFYVTSKQHLFGMMWGGIWPLGLLLIASLQARMSWVFAARTAALVIAGFVLAGLPLAIFNVSNGAFSYWINDVFQTPLLQNGQEFIVHRSYATLLQMAWQNLTSGAGIVPAVSAVAWTFLILSVPAIGAIANYRLYKSKPVHPIAILAVFWALGGLHHQIPIYLMFVMPAVLFGLLFLHSGRIALVFLVAVSGWALVFQAAQPLDRGLSGIVAGQRGVSYVATGLPRVSLRIPQDDAMMFREVVEVIEKNANPEEPLMTIPMDPELNFITDRKSPVRYYGTFLGLRSERDVTETIVALNATAPLYVVHRRQDKYLTPLSVNLLKQVRVFSDPPVSIGPFDLYRYRGAQQSDVPTPKP